MVATPDLPICIQSLEAARDLGIENEKSVKAKRKPKSVGAIVRTETSNTTVGAYYKDGKGALLRGDDGEKKETKRTEPICL